MTIITTVGTSIFTNIFKNGGHNTIQDKYDLLKDEPFSKWGDYAEKHIESKNGLRTRVSAEISKINQNASAEIKSLIKIGEVEKQDLTVYLLATDTILSVLACQLIKEWFDKRTNETLKVNVLFNERQDIIKDLRIDKLADFKNGLTELVNRFYTILNTVSSDFLILNITGGYKAIIPYMTILGQVNKVKVNYIFEETEELIEIPRLPLMIDDTIFNDYFDVFTELEDNELLIKDHYQFIQDAESCLEVYPKTGNFILNSLGDMLWKQYKKRYFFFSCTDIIFEDIQKQKDIQRILETKFYSPEERYRKSKSERQHKTVFIDGDNGNRIYYFEKNNQVFIYKVFENHRLHEEFLWTDFNDLIKNDTIKNSKPRKIKIAHV
jgi:putative CRISPR-associated protein (TIGR02619 family)